MTPRLFADLSDVTLADEDNNSIPTADTLGGWHGVANEQVQKLGVALARQSGEDEDQTVRHLRQRLSLLLMRGNSALLINRVPESEMDPEIAGYE